MWIYPHLFSEVIILIIDEFFRGWNVQGEAEL